MADARPERDQPDHGGAVRLLGPVEVTGPRGRAGLTGARQRILVGVLALHTGSVLAQSRLVEALWGQDPPRTAVNSLHSHVARVRQALAGAGLAGVLLTRARGYAMALPGDDVDARRFEEQVRQARRELAGGDLGLGAEWLRAGLALWRGEPFEDAEPAGWAVAEATRLTEMRISALEDLWDVQLRLGAHASAVSDVERLLVAYPYRERLVGLLMVALCRAGRPTEALDRYRLFRTYLAEEMGAGPGPELDRLHTTVLRGELVDSAGFPLGLANANRQAATVSSVRPAELPPTVGHFAGRLKELNELGSLLDTHSGDVRVVVISGCAGIGKTALAVQWAHQVRDRFPDGQLVVDLQGFDRTGTEGSVGALAQLLRALGVPGDRIPTQRADRVGLYRSLVYAKRILVLVDNCARAEDVLPLVPANSGSLLVVTSRHHLAALSAHHRVHAVSLDVLTADDSLCLLRLVLGDSRVNAEPQMVRQLVDLCGGMPLALRIAAAKLAARAHRPVRDLVTDLLTSGQLAVLAMAGDSRSVRTVFTSAYRDLSPSAARMFRLTGLHPGPSFGAELGAAAADVSIVEAQNSIDELIGMHLMFAVSGGRCRSHDLIRCYAQERVRLDDTEEERRFAVGRMLDWYLAVAEAASRVLDPHRDRVVPPLGYRPAELPFSAQPHSVLAFLDGERDNLTPVVEYAARNGFETVAWQLTYLLTGYFDARGNWSDRVEVCRWGLAAAQHVGDRVAEGLMRSALAVACLTTRRFDEALQHLGPALRLMRESGDQRGEGHVYNNIAAVYTALGRFDEAIVAFDRALALHTGNHHQLGMALALNNVGHLHTLMGNTGLSLDRLAEALRLTVELGHQRLQGVVRHSIGQAYARRGEHSAAFSHLYGALAIRRDIGERRSEADTLREIGLVSVDAGDPAAALESFSQVVVISRELADQHLEALVLNNLGTAYLRTGDLALARRHLCDAVELRSRTPDVLEEAAVHANLAELADRSGDAVACAHHTDRAKTLRDRAHAGTPGMSVTTAAALPTTPCDGADITR